MSFHRAIRQAVVARLKAEPQIADKVFSSPPANIKPPVIVVGQISDDGSTSKDGGAGFYSVGIETWAQTTSPLDLDLHSDLVAETMKGAPLASAAAVLSSAYFAGEADAFNPDAPGGPILSRTQTFRIFAQPLET